MLVRNGHVLTHPVVGTEESVHRQIALVVTPSARSGRCLREPKDPYRDRGQRASDLFERCGFRTHSQPVDFALGNPSALISGADDRVTSRQGDQNDAAARTVEVAPRRAVLVGPRLWRW